MELFAVDCLLDESKNYLLDSLNVVHDCLVLFVYTKHIGNLSNPVTNSCQISQNKTDFDLAASTVAI